MPTHKRGPKWVSSLDFPINRTPELRLHPHYRRVRFRSRRPRERGSKCARILAPLHGEPRIGRPCWRRIHNAPPGLLSFFVGKREDGQPRQLLYRPLSWWHLLFGFPVFGFLVLLSAIAIWICGDLAFCRPEVPRRLAAIHSGTGSWQLWPRGRRPIQQPGLSMRWDGVCE